MNRPRKTPVKRSARRMTVIFALTASMLTGVSARVAQASSGLNNLFWSGAGVTLSTTSYSSSNATAFWQAILNSANRCVVVDGIFGSQTASATAVTKIDPAFAEFGPLPFNGIVDAATWNAFEFSMSGGGYRHQQTGYIDGYGDQYYTYYGGGTYEAHQAWNPFVPNWFFSPYPITQAGQSTGWTLFPAISTRTIGSYPCDV